MLPLYESLRHAPPSFRRRDTSPIAELKDDAVGRLIDQTLERGTEAQRRRLVEDWINYPPRVRRCLEMVLEKRLARGAEVHRIATIALAEPSDAMTPRAARALMVALLRTKEGTRPLDKASYERLVAATQMETAHLGVARFVLRVMEDLLGREDTSQRRAIEMTALLYRLRLVTPLVYQRYWLPPPQPVLDVAPIPPAYLYRLHKGLLLARRDLNDHPGAVRSIRRMVSLAAAHGDETRAGGLGRLMASTFADAMSTVEVDDAMLETAAEAIIEAEGVIDVPDAVLGLFELGMTARPQYGKFRMDLLARIVEAQLPTVAMDKSIADKDRHDGGAGPAIVLTPDNLARLPAAIAGLLSYHGRQAERMAMDDDELHVVLESRQWHRRRFEAIVSGICTAVRMGIYRPSAAMRRSLLKPIVRHAQLALSTAAYHRLRSPDLVVENQTLLDYVRLTTYQVSGSASNEQTVRDAEFATMIVSDWLVSRRRPPVPRIRPPRTTRAIEDVVPNASDDPLAEYDLTHFDLTTLAAAASLMGSIELVVSAARSMVARGIVPDAHDIHVVYHALKQADPARADVWLQRAINNGFTPDATFFDHRREGMDIDGIRMRKLESPSYAPEVRATHAEDRAAQMRSLTATRLIERPRKPALAVDRFVRVATASDERAERAIEALKQGLPIRPRLVKLVLNDAIVRKRLDLAFRLHGMAILRGIHERRMTTTIARALIRRKRPWSRANCWGVYALAENLMARPALDMPFLDVARLLRLADGFGLRRNPEGPSVSSTSQKWHAFASQRLTEPASIAKLGNLIKRRDREPMRDDSVH